MGLILEVAEEDKAGKEGEDAPGKGRGHPISPNARKGLAVAVGLVGHLQEEPLLPI